MRHWLAAALVALLPWAALAQTAQTAVLEVRNMNCGLCPLTVKKALEKVPGVREARVDYAQKTATVTFDADQTRPAALVAAVTEAGFPATLTR